MRTDRCCCCVDVWTGTMIIGCLLLLDLFIELRWPNEIRLVIKLAAITSFVVMVWRDLELTRMVFFFIYCINRVTEIYNDLWTIDE